ncbi:MULTISPECIES: type IV toxin-antitoxin system AbiEi family antitoxin domain-containing protein [Bacteroidota]|uniref:type IV toxin-antitoxin system AbiEi family antitoxin domain-containing protein n=1 Tax=Bacteroidota TaxID=976 RepID=UPI0025C598A9|nr:MULTISPECIES: hypothetical protein [Bacteroidota]
MANKPRVVSILPKIKALMHSTGKRVFDVNYLQNIFEDNNDKWRLPLSMDLSGFINSLEKYSDELIIDSFAFPGMKKQVVAHFEDASIYDIVSSIFPDGYLSHYSAITLWGLTEQIPKSIYLTLEQSTGPAKSIKGVLEQGSIDSAFQRPQRLSETITEYNNHRLILLKGKHTRRLGVDDMSDNKGSSSIKVTDIERTLIDIAVRPEYSGGIYEVLKAYRLAKDNHSVSINKISGYLNKMDFIYPYHQAIGFYLERAGNYSDKMIELLKRKPMNYDFYLTYEMKKDQMRYSEKWRLYYPKGLD